MKISLTKIFFFLFIICFTTNKVARCELLDGSSSVVYRPSNFPFNDTTNQLKGYVCLNNGFTVIPQASSSSQLDYSGCVPISGIIDLRETSTINLLNDIEFDDSVTFSSGGHIYGNGNSIILQGNLTIPANKIIHFSSSNTCTESASGGTNIRGNGNTIFIDRWAQIFVDTNATLTISNATIKFTPGCAPGYPPIRLAAPSSKLALDNVTLDLSNADNFHFIQGKFYIHNDVIISGTSSFIYQSPNTSFIAPGGCLYFDNGTTFSIAPSTFTTLPISSAVNDCNFINMADQSSSLYLNNCSLMTTHTGCKFTKGSVFIDNNVAIDSNTTSSVSSFSSTLYQSASHETGGYVYWVRWHPNGKLLLAQKAPSDNSAFSLYKFTGSNLSYITKIDVITDAIFSKDGRFVTSCATTTNIYRLVDESFSTFATGISIAVLGDFSPDDKYYVTATTSTIYVYNFVGNNFVEIIRKTVPSGHADPQWSPDGKYIACKYGTGASSCIRVYKFNGNSLTFVAQTNTFAASIYPYEWSPDGRSIAVGPLANAAVICGFDGTNFISYSSTTDLAAYLVRGLSWSPDGKYLAIGKYTDTRMLIYQVDNSRTIVNGGKHIAASPAIAQKASNVDNHWNPNGKFIAAGVGTDGYVYIFTPLFTKDTTPQFLSNSVVFGDSAKGSTYDATVNILPQAKIDLKGKMYVDNVEE